MRPITLLLAVLLGHAASDLRGDPVEPRFNPFGRWSDTTDYYGYGVLDWPSASRLDKEGWVRHCLALDNTNNHAPGPGWVCLQYAVQAYVNFGGYDGPLPAKFDDPLYSTPNRFNLPVYAVSVASSSYGHSINGILTGSDPLDFSDWFFFEPQNDRAVRPGEWNMPRETLVFLHFVENLSDGGYVDHRLISWEMPADLQPVLLSYDPLLVVPEPGSLSLLLGVVLLAGLRLTWRKRCRRLPAAGE